MLPCPEALPEGLGSELSNDLNSEPETRNCLPAGEPSERYWGWARRGLGRPNAEITTALFSERVEDRIRLVNGIVAARGINTATWLQLFTEDPDAEVRKAWQRRACDDPG